MFPQRSKSWQPLFILTCVNRIQKPHPPYEYRLLISSPPGTSLWKVEQAINQINQTYEIDTDLEAYNYRGHLLLTELKEQIERYACSGAVWTQTTDVEGEVNGCKLTGSQRTLSPFLLTPINSAMALLTLAVIQF